MSRVRHMYVYLRSLFSFSLQRGENRKKDESCKKSVSLKKNRPLNWSKLAFVYEILNRKQKVSDISQSIDAIRLLWKIFHHLVLMSRYWKFCVPIAKLRDDRMQFICNFAEAHVAVRMWRWRKIMICYYFIRLFICNQST